jgi:DNA-binding transcriptional LysR family regulator
VALHGTFPNIRFSLVEGPTGGLVDWLNRGMIDFALLEESAHSHQLREQRLVSLPLGLVGPCESELPTDRVFSFEEAVRLPLVLPSHHLGIRAVINDAAIRAQAVVASVIEADSPRLAKELVRGGMGYSILPRAYYAREVAEGTLKGWAIDEPGLALEIFLCSRKGRHFAEVENLIERLGREI